MCVISYFCSLERHEILALSKPGAKLSSDSRERAKILFANGEEMAYGIVIRLVFTSIHRDSIHDLSCKRRLCISSMFQLFLYSGGLE